MHTCAMLLAGLASALSLSVPALAQVHDGDIVLQVQQGQIVTGAGSGAAFAERRVFLSNLDFFGEPFADDPGFDCLAGTFPLGSRNAFVIMDALRKWDGAGLATVPPERMEISFAGGALATMTPAAPEVVLGFSLAIQSNGGWHRHLDYWLQAADGVSPPTPGVYVLQLTLTNNSTSPAIAPSTPFWIVFNHLAPNTDQDAAAQWIVDTILTPGGGCDSIDFNADGLFPDSTDLDDFVAVLAGGPGACSTGTCNDVDFNNDGLFPDSMDLDAFLSRLAGGVCVR